MTAPVPPPFAQPGAAFGPPPIRPSVAWFWIGGLLLVAGVVGAIGWAVYQVVQLDDEVEDFVRTEGRESVTFTVERARGFTVYDETFGDLQGFVVPDAVRRSDTGEALALSVYEGSLTYDFGHAGVAVRTVYLEPGSYQLNAPAGSSYAIGPSIAPRIASLGLGAILIGGLGFVAGVTVLIVTGVRRNRARRQVTGYGPAPWAAPTAWQPEAAGPTQWTPGGPSPPSSGWSPPAAAPPPVPPGRGAPPPPPPAPPAGSGL